MKTQTEALSQRELSKIRDFLRSPAGIIGSLACSVWILSGDSLGLKQRYENLLIDGQFISETIGDVISEPGSDAKPSVTTSLRPNARPDKR